jgi:hypothetical protein
MPAKRQKKSLPPKPAVQTRSQILGAPLTLYEEVAQYTRATMSSQEELADLYYKNAKGLGKPITRKKALEMAESNIEFTIQYNIETAQQHQAREARSMRSKLGAKLEEKSWEILAVLLLTGVSLAIWWFTTGRFNN